MAQLIIDIPDPIATDVIDTLAFYWGYNDAFGPKTAWVKGKIIEHMKIVYQRGKERVYEESYVRPADPDLT